MSQSKYSKIASEVTSEGLKFKINEFTCHTHLVYTLRITASVFHLHLPLVSYLSHVSKHVHTSEIVIIVILSISYMLILTIVITSISSFYILGVRILMLIYSKLIRSWKLISREIQMRIDKPLIQPQTAQGTSQACPP